MWRSLVAAALVLSNTLGALAQAWPVKPLRVIVPVTAGSAIDIFFSPTLPTLPLLQDGKLKAIAVSSSKRASALPDVPTTLEAGFADSDYNFWIGMFVPAKTPREIIDRLHQETAKVLQMPGVREKLAALGGEPMTMSASEFDAFLHAEIAMNAALVKAAGIKAN
jgi:tripartite-type tricarboxylate transporter receptor subunit TctC